jgi:hypothetical protein
MCAISHRAAGTFHPDSGFQFRFRLSAILFGDLNPAQALQLNKGLQLA